jgi:hypothetical protein
VTTVDGDKLRARARGEAGEGPYPWGQQPTYRTGPIFRTFETGACRDTDHGKIDPEGFLDPAVIRAFSEYMHRNRTMADGSVRDSDNWRRGIPLDAYMKSLWRHFLDVWEIHRGRPDDPTEALCGVLFNSMGYLSEVLKDDK